ncbi:hypothetical protein L0B53_06010 [Vibrio sp. SS-MA-C1-2]|uniref:hypothetical protein n=1 Tax=Vibrio sp. SS-MA-C1-2 TaxID=2908646 RepID=UPI001F475877|nr:hypothetical protein [Vibrio sp. SS-MA-C1-2]UJF19131.1 hypothetical protein L0B53_06010 [Vibrio sp. SS-MA-C1-2]
MNRFTPLKAISLLALLASSTASATTNNYNFVSFAAGYYEARHEDYNISEDATDIFVQGSKLLNKELIFTGDYEGSFVDQDNYDVQQHLIRMGLDYRAELTSNLDLFFGGKVGYVYSKFEAEHSSYEDDSSDFIYGPHIGLKSTINKLELNATYGYYLGADDDVNEAKAGFIYNINKKVGFGLSYRYQEASDLYSNTYLAEVRLKFQ